MSNNARADIDVRIIWENVAVNCANSPTVCFSRHLTIACVELVQELC